MTEHNCETCRFWIVSETRCPHHMGPKYKDDKCTKWRPIEQTKKKNDCPSIWPFGGPSKCEVKTAPVILRFSDYEVRVPDRSAPRNIETIGLICPSCHYTHSGNDFHGRTIQCGPCGLIMRILGNALECSYGDDNE